MALHIPLQLARVVLHKLRPQQMVVMAQILYLLPSHQLAVVRAAAQLPALLVRLVDREEVQETAEQVELLVLAQQIKVLRVAHQLARREITLVPVVVAQVLRLQA
jgi:hypothetical protein